MPTSAPAAEAQAGDWTVTLDADAAWHRATPVGIVVVGTATGVVGLDGATGRTRWQIADPADAHALALDVLPRAPYGLLRLEERAGGHLRRILIDVQTGTALWDSGSLGMMDVFLHLYVPSLDALLLSGRTATRDTILLVDVTSGRSLHPFAPPNDVTNILLSAALAFDTESTVVIGLDRRLRQFALATGFPTWTSPPLEPGRAEPCGLIPDVRTGNDVPKRTDPRPLPPPAPLMLTTDGRRILALEGSALHAVDVSDGRDVWSRPPTLCGRAIGVSEVAGGLLVSTMPEINGDDLLYMIDGTNGGVRWRYPPAPTNASSALGSIFRTNVTLSNPIVDGADVVVVAGTRLVRLDLLTGASRGAGKTKVDEPTALVRLERSEHGFLVVGSQTMDWLDAAGKSQRHVEFSAPGDVSMGLVLLATSALFNKAGTVRGNHSELTFYGSYRPGMERLMRQFHATSVFDSLVFILADLDDDDYQGLALVAVDKQGGQRVGRIPVQREPKLEFDPVNGWLFVADRKTVRGHRF